MSASTVRTIARTDDTRPGEPVSWFDHCPSWCRGHRVAWELEDGEDPGSIHLSREESVDFGPIVHGGRVQRRGRSLAAIVRQGDGEAAAILVFGSLDVVTQDEAAEVAAMFARLAEPSTT